MLYNYSDFGDVRYTLRLHYLITILLLLSIFSSCSTRHRERPEEPSSPEIQIGREPEVADGHLQLPLLLTNDTESGEFEIVPDRSAQTHLDLAYFWKYYPGMLQVQLIELNTTAKEVTLRLIFSNPLEKQLRDVRMIFTDESPLNPLTFDGWTLRAGAEIDFPDKYFIFGQDSDIHAVEPHESVLREIIFKYSPPYTGKIVPFVLDAVVNNNTAEPYEFGVPSLTGRLFQIAISDWQDDITSVELNNFPLHLPTPLQLAKLGEGKIWATSIPDVDPGDYRVRVTASSPELPGEIGEGEPALAVHYVDLKWPPDEPVIPLPVGNGIYVYSFVDPDTNTLPTNGPAFMDKFRNDMGGDFLVMEYGEICNSGYLSMHSWVPVYIDWMTQYAPDLPIHLNLDNLGFPPIDEDPCMHPPENYTQKFFDNLLESIRGQILENPDFDDVAGLHFDIEIFPGQYDEDTLFEIYARYADFLARLHLEPLLNGRNITVYEFDRHPVRNVPSLAYLCTTDAFFGEAYYERFSWQWNPDTDPVPYYGLMKIIGNHNTWARQYGRPWYAVPGTFSGWFDGNKDTLGNFTLCPDSQLVLIDDYCFGKGIINTINEFDIVRAHDIHNLYVEKVILNLNSGEAIFPANGFAVYLMGDGDPETDSDDIVFCRTAYAMTKSYWMIEDDSGPWSNGTVIFRYENNQIWKAYAYSHPLGRGDITGISGRVRFGDGTDIQLHPELWGEITIELVDPPQEIIDNPCYMKSIDFVGVVDGSYIFPDLPRDTVTIRAVADGWASEPVTLDMTGNFAYRDDIDLIINPQ